MRKRKLTPTQEQLLQKLAAELKNGKSYEELKKAADFRSFDGSFNALLVKNHIKRAYTATGAEIFKLN